MGLKKLAMAMAIAAVIPASADVLLVGDVPTFESRNLQANLNLIWQHEAKTYLRAPANLQNTQPPEIGFFDFETASEAPDWRAWQKDWIRNNPSIWTDWTTVSGLPPGTTTKDWINQHIDTVFPFPATFLGFHYDHTNRIQLSPHGTFLRFYVNDPYGVKRETVGYGFYVASHEMLHYVLENDGIPGRLHHCLFISEKNGHSLMGDLTQFLLDNQISEPLVRNVGFENERSMMPCDQLTDAERGLVAKYLAESDIWK